MSPSASFATIELVKEESCPEAVKVLWENYLKLALDEDEVVPDELKVIRRTLQWTSDTPFADVAPLGSTGREI